MKPIVHLSDIHFTASETGLARRNEALRIDLLNDLRGMRQNLGPAEAIIVTGDIAFSGLPAEYALARTWLDEVADAVDVPRTSVLCIPGNHDVTRSSIGPTGEAIRQRLRSCDEGGVDPILDDFMSEPHQPILAPLSNYNGFASAFRCDVGENGQACWQVEFALHPNWLLTVRGVTTVLSSDQNDRRANLVVGRTQATLPLDRQDRIYMVLAHHPPDWWLDQDMVLDTMRHRARVLLCGHKHRQLVEQVDDSVRIVAGAVHPEEDQQWEPRYNWLVFDVLDGNPAKLLIRIHKRVFRDNRFQTDFTDGREYDERRLELGGPQRIADINQERSGEPGRPEDTREEPVPAAVGRPPLLGPTGEPDPSRDAVRAFLDLPYPSQISVLQTLNLIEEDDRDKGFVAIAVAAFKRAHERGQDQRLAAEIAERANVLDRQQQAERQ